MNRFLLAADTHLSLVRARASVQVEEAVAVGAKVAAHVTQDDGRRLAVIVIVAHRLWIRGGGNPFSIV